MHGMEDQEQLSSGVRIMYLQLEVKYAFGNTSEAPNPLLVMQCPDDAMVLPRGLSLIDEEAFAGTRAGWVWVPDGCGIIGVRAFASIPGQVIFEVPENVRIIAEDAFEGTECIFICRDGSASWQYARMHGIRCLPVYDDGF